eukprot:scaffold16929_cov44-Cyclotella_meneghiniana.AAC.3
MVETVKFNVGGKMFEVSRALIDQHPNTMLSTMISENWETDTDEPLFIDRDGDIFSHVMNYCRYGSIDLPASIPKSMFQRELDYYGITSKDADVRAMSLYEFTKNNNEELKRKQKEIAHNKLVSDMLAFASECQCKLFRSKKDNGIIPESVDYLFQRNDVLYRLYGEEFIEAKNMLRKYLNEYYGLSVKLIETVKRGTRTMCYDENISIDSADYEEDDDDDDDSCCDLGQVAKGLRISVMK